MFHPLRPCHGLAAAGAVMLVLTFSGQVQGQQPDLGNQTTVEVPFRKVEQEFLSYIYGKKQASGPQDAEAKDVAKKAANWHVWQLVYKHGPSVARKFKALMDDAVNNKANNQVFMQLFNQQMIAYFKILLDAEFRSHAVPQINAGVMFPALARYGDEEFGKYLIEVAKSSKVHDAIKLYALKGLREFFRAKPPQPAQDEQKVGAEDVARLDVVLAFLMREAPKNLTPEEAEAFRFVRREAVKALAQAAVPAGSISKDEVKVPVALALLQVLAPEKNGISPPSSMTEKAEAAVGLLSMRAVDLSGVVRFESYQPEAAIYLVGKFLTDFGDLYQTDEPNLAKGSNIPTLLPWKNYADKLVPALQEMKKRTPPGAAYRANLDKLVESGTLLLEAIKIHRRVDEPLANLKSTVKQMWPQAPTLSPYAGFTQPQLQVKMP
jgi:hypothetical protein